MSLASRYTAEVEVQGGESAVVPGCDVSYGLVWTLCLADVESSD